MLPISWMAKCWSQCQVSVRVFLTRSGPGYLQGRSDPNGEGLAI